MDSLQTTTAAIRRRRLKAEEHVASGLPSATKADLLSPAVIDPETTNTNIAAPTEAATQPPQEVVAPETEIAEAPATASTKKVAPSAPTLTPDELKRQRRRAQASTARDQRKRHALLMAEWMPTQRGAVILIDTIIGHQAIQSWFERTYMKRAKMLWKMHSFPKVVLTYEQIAKIEQSALDAVTKTETKLNALMSQLDTLI